MSEHPTQPDQPSAKRGVTALSVFAGAGLTGLSVYLLVIGQPILMPLVIAGFLVILLDAMAARICKIPLGDWRVPSWLGMAIAILVMIGIAVWIVDLVVGNISAVRQNIPDYQENVNGLIERGLALFGLETLPSLAEVRKQIDFGNLVGRVINGFTSVTGSTFTILFYVIFILLEQTTFKSKIHALFPESNDAEKVRATITRIAEDIQTYAALKTLVSLMVGGASYIVLILVGVDLAGFWAVLIFVLNFIPYVGSLIGVVFPALLTLIQFDTLTPFFIVAITLTGAQVIVGNVVEPRLMGRSLNLSPLVILLALSVFGSIWGIVGMILSIPMMVIAMIVCAQFDTTRPAAIIMSADGQVESRH